MSGSTKKSPKLRRRAGARVGRASGRLEGVGAMGALRGAAAPSVVSEDGAAVRHGLGRDPSVHSIRIDHAHAVPHEARVREHVPWTLEPERHLAREEPLRQEAAEQRVGGDENVVGHDSEYRERHRPEDQIDGEQQRVERRAQPLLAHVI